MGRHSEEEEDIMKRSAMDLALSGAKREKYFTEILFYESHFFTSQAKH